MNGDFFTHFICYMCWTFIHYGDIYVCCRLHYSEVFMMIYLFSTPFFNIPEVIDAIVIYVLHLANKAKVRYQID